MFLIGFATAVAAMMYLGIGFFFYVAAEARVRWVFFWPLMVIVAIIKNLMDGD